MCKSQYLLDKKYKAVFFDFGDTLSFNNQTFVEGLYKILKKLDINVNINKLKTIILMADQGTLTEERLKAKELENYDAFRIKYYNYVLDLLGYPQTDNKIGQLIHKMIPYYNNTYLMPETNIVLSTLRERGYILGIVSNFSHALPKICDELGITDKVDFITYSDDVGSEKPLPYIFEDALSKAGVKPEEAIHIGDSYHADVLGARAMGITPILLRDENLFDDCICINNLLDILTLLGIEFMGV